jgi:hypothetical protein
MLGELEGGGVGCAGGLEKGEAMFEVRVGVVGSIAVRGGEGVGARPGGDAEEGRGGRAVPAEGDD